MTACRRFACHSDAFLNAFFNLKTNRKCVKWFFL